MSKDRFECHAGSMTSHLPLITEAARDTSTEEDNSKPRSVDVRQDARKMLVGTSRKPADVSAKASTYR